MKPLFKFFTLFLILFCFKVCAQDKLTLYYDQNGKGLDTKKKAVYYRIVAFDDNNKPVGIVSDFYISGKPFKTGHATNIDKFDDSKSLWIGQVTTYSEKGLVYANNNYDADGNLDSVQTVFTAEGNTETSQYLHGNPTKDYFLVQDKKGATTRYSYLTHLPMKLSTSDKVIVPIMLRKVIYQDGQPVQFYNIDGMSVAVKISTKQLYGDYYEAYITIENGTQPQFDFDPSNITASLEYENSYTEAEVLTYEDYMKKVKRRQGWTTAFSAFAEAAAATSAGYSSTKTNAYATTSTGKSVAVQATTTSYNGAATYAAAQNGANNINNLVNQQYDIKQTISEGYLKLNTVFPNARLVGFVNIKKEDADHILINVPVNGKVYHFEL